MEEDQESQEEKSDALVAATEILSSRVGALADAVLINNRKIDGLQHEVNTKPDDAEVRFITGLAETERKRHLKVALATGIASSIMAAFVAYAVADAQGSERCKINDENIATIVRLLESLPDEDGRFTATIVELKENRNEC